MPLHILGGLAATRAWPEAAFARVCRLVAAGALINSVASEREMGSPSRGGAFATLASQQTAGSWRLSGRKIFATGAPARCAINRRRSALCVPQAGQKGRAARGTASRRPAAPRHQ